MKLYICIKRLVSPKVGSNSTNYWNLLRMKYLVTYIFVGTNYYYFYKNTMVFFWT